jgi:hypothetical protein
MIPEIARVRRTVSVGYNSRMHIVAISRAYFTWHYGRSLGEALAIWGNFLRFTLHFFSVPLLLRTLFSPWRRMHEGYSKEGGFDISTAASALVVNLLMRFIGFLVRTVLIVLGLLFFILVAVSGIMAALLWLLAPLLVVVLLAQGSGTIIIVLTNPTLFSNVIF